MVLERGALDELHDDVESFILDKVIKLYDVGMAQAGHRLRLSPETFKYVIGRMAVQDLEGHVSIPIGLVRLVHVGCPAPIQAGANVISAEHLANKVVHSTPLGRTI